MERNQSHNVLILMVLAALWSPSFLFMKVAVGDFPPLWVALGRVAIGGLLLLLIMTVQGRRMPSRGPVWRHLAVIGLVQSALPFLLFSWGEQYISSALASILNGMTPIFTIILAHFFVATDRLTSGKIVGAVLGFAGLVLILLPSLSAGFQSDTLGALAIVVATILYGVAGVYSANHMRGLPPLVAPTGQLLAASVMLLPFAMVVNPIGSFAMPSWQAIASLVALGALGTGLAFVFYYRLLETAEPSFISLVTYVIPIFGVLLGVVFLDEALTLNALFGFVLILAGVAVASRKKRVKGDGKQVGLGTSD